VQMSRQEDMADLDEGLSSMKLDSVDEDTISDLLQMMRSLILVLLCLLAASYALEKEHP